jgi:hypothetical protein
MTRGEVILARVADECGVSVEQIVGKRKCRSITEARHMAVREMRGEGMNDRAIGFAMKRRWQDIERIETDMYVTHLGDTDNRVDCRWYDWCQNDAVRLGYSSVGCRNCSKRHGKVLYTPRPQAAFRLEA